MTEESDDIRGRVLGYRENGMGMGEAGKVVMTVSSCEDTNSALEILFQKS
jgi:hypothetical protein